MLAVFVGGCTLTWFWLNGRLGGGTAAVFLDPPASVQELERASAEDRHEDVVALEAEAMASIPEWAAEWRAVTARNVARSYLRLNRPFEAIERDERALDDLADLYERACTHSSLVALLHRVGQRDRARAHAWSFAQIVASGVRAPRMTFEQVCVSMFMAACATEDGDDVDRHIATATAAAEQHPNDIEVTLLTSFGLAELALNRHDPETALRFLERDLPTMLEHQREGTLPTTIHPAFAHQFLAEARARLDLPVPVLGPALSYGRAIAGPDSLVHITDARTRGYMALAEGDVSGAAAAFGQGMDRARAIEHPALEAGLAYHHALELHRRGHDADEALGIAWHLASNLGQSARLHDLDAVRG